MKRRSQDEGEVGLHQQGRPDFPFFLFGSLFLDLSRHHSPHLFAFNRTLPLHLRHHIHAPSRLITHIPSRTSVSRILMSICIVYLFGQKWIRLDGTTVS